MNEAQLVRTIKAHIAKGDKAKDKAEQHYIAAGQYLKQLKDDCPDQQTFLEKVEKEIGIGKSRTYELLQIGEGRKTVAEVRADTAKRVAKHVQSRPLANGQNADNPEASAEARKALYAESDDADLGAAAEAAEDELANDPSVLMQRRGESDEDFAARSDEWHKHIEEHNVGGPEGVAALEAIARIPKENLGNFLSAVQERYPDEDDEQSSEATFTLYRGEPDEDIIRTLVRAIGTDRTRALGKNISALIFKAVGRAALPDCELCNGTGEHEYELHNGSGKTLKFPHECECIRRRRGENDFATFKSRLDRENEQHNQGRGIPEQAFGFGIEVKTKDGKVWTSGVRVPTEEEAAFYFDYWARNDLRKHGYKSTYEGEPDSDLVGFEIKRYDEQPLMRIWGGRRKSMSFMHGTCALLGPKGWAPISGGECSCKNCKERRAFWEKYEAEKAA
jgi:hypothetical protein